MSLDDALAHIGKWGKWQLMTYSILCLAFGLSGAWQLFAIVFIGVFNDTWCRPKENVSLAMSSPLVTDPLTGQLIYDRCMMWTNATDSTSNKSTVRCQYGQDYDRAGFEEKGTMTMEWDLVCEKDLYVETSQTVFNVGVCLGAAFCTPWADKFGRKKLFFVSLFFMLLFGMCMAFSPNYVAFCSFQFLTGAFSQGLVMAGFVTACEVFHRDLRTIMAPAAYLFWAAGMMSLTIFAYFIRNWRNFQLAISIPPVIFFVYYWWCPESLRWLVANGKYDEALEILQKAAKFNGKPPLPKGILESGTGKMLADSERPTIFRMMKNRKTLSYMAVMLFLVFANNVMYFGLSLLTSVLAGDRYINFFIVSVIEVPGVLTVIYLINRFGRRWPLCFFHIFSGIFMGFSGLFATESINLDEGVDRAMLVGIMAIVAKFGVSGAFCIELIYAQEIYPTVIRSTGLGITAGFGFVGAILAPYSVYLFRINPTIPGFIFGGMSIIAGCLTLLEPETLGRPLPDTVEQIAAWPRALTSEEKEALKKMKMFGGSVEPRDNKEDQKKAYTTAASGHMYQNGSMSPMPGGYGEKGGTTGQNAKSLPSGHEKGSDNPAFDAGSVDSTLL